MSTVVPKHPGLYHEELASGENRYRIVIRHKGVTHQRYFYYGKVQSKTAALKRAKTEWNALREKYPVLTPQARAMLRKPAPGSPIVGVRRVTNVSKGHEYESWEANWTDRKGNRHTRRFAIKKHGVRKAKQLAIEARQDGVAKR